MRNPEGLDVRFLVGDVTDPDSLDLRSCSFQLAVNIGCLHMIAETEDRDKTRDPICSLKTMKKTNLNTEQNNGIPAVFLDRDGTIIEDRGDSSDPSQVVFFRDTVSSLRCLSAHFALFIVTNQSGVAEGAISMREVEHVNSHIRSYLSTHGITFLATYVCPHKRVSGCPCIKPNPYFLKKAERDFGIDLGRSFVIGDHPQDVELAINAGANGIYLLSGHGMKHRDALSRGTEVARGIKEAAEIIRERVEATRETENKRHTNT